MNTSINSSRDYTRPMPPELSLPARPLPAAIGEGATRPLPAAINGNGGIESGLPGMGTTGTAPGATTPGTMDGAATGPIASSMASTTASSPSSAESSGSASTAATGSSGGASSSTSSSSSGTGSTSGTDVTGTNTFLQLLVAQMRNQDPTQPMDSQSFVTELAQFNSVEQLLSLKETIATQTTALQETQGIALLGRTVTYAVPGVGSAPSTTNQGVVTGVSIANGTVQLKVGTQPVGLDSVVAVS